MSNVIIDYQIHYLIYPYRSASSKERLYTLCNELTTPIQTVKGFSILLELEMKDSEEIPQFVVFLQQDLACAGQQLTKIKKGMLPDCNCGQAADYDEHLRLFRSQIIGPINLLRASVAYLPTLRTDLETILSDTPQFIKSVTSATHHIWAVVDALTNPDLQLPSYVTDWIDARDEIGAKARNKDTSILEELHHALQNSIVDIRCEAAKLLQYVQDSRSVPFLIPILDDDKPEVRAEVAETLGVLGDKRAIEPLIKSLLKYRDGRWGASEALGNLGAENAVSALKQVLEEEVGSLDTPVTNSRTVVSIKNALKAIGNPEAERVFARYWSQK